MVYVATIGSIVVHTEAIGRQPRRFPCFKNVVSGSLLPVSTDSEVVTLGNGVQNQL